jgi:RHS repeat-associated protein
MTNHMRTLLTTVLVFAAVAASSQTNPNLEQGFKPFGTYDEGSFDSVSMTNHNLIVQIPLFDYPQRGALHTPLKLLINNKNYIVKVNCTNSNNCVTFWSWAGGGGFTAPFLDDGAATTSSRTFKDSRGVLVTTWATTTRDGAVHQLTGSVHGGYESIDTTGLWYSGTTGSVDRMGNGLNSNSQLSDTNGNFLQEATAPPPYTFTDTIGRNLYATISTGDASICNGPLPVTGATIYAYPGPGGISRQIQACTATITVNTHFGAFSSQYGQAIREITNNQQSINQSLIVYDGQSWATSPQWIFEWNDADPGDPAGTNYGDLTKITLPTGGTISYAWTKWSNIAWCAGELTPMSRALTQRTINANDGTGDHITTYTFASGNVATTVTDPAGNDTVHTATGLSGSCSAYETQADYYKGTGGTRTLLKTVQTAYSSTSNPYDEYGDGTATRANVVVTSVTTKWPTGGGNYLVSQVQTDYDSSFTVTAPSGGSTSGGTYRLLREKREYDYGTNAPGLLLRKTDYTYAALTNSNYLNPNILDLVTQETAYNGSGTQIAQTNYTYDGTPLQSSGITMHHNTVANPGYRGNLTLVQKWLNTTGGLVTTKQTSYYDTGMPYQSTDLKGNATTYSYDPAYNGAYVTQTQSPSTGSGNSITHIAKGSYDFNTGLLTSFTDQNNQISSYGYDVLGRMQSAAYPDGGAITLSYVDSVPVQIGKTVKVTSTLNKVSNTVFDGLGRVSQAQLNDPDCTTGSLLVKTDYAYGFDTTQNTKFSTVTTPYCDTPGAVYGLSSRTDSDALGRPIKVTQTDGSVASTSYAANCTTVTDEAGKSRKSCSDGLGRLTGVWEDPSSLNYETDYTYDVMDNLWSVTQKGGDPSSSNWRTRSFFYDSLSRLMSATNPESGIISYTYSNTSAGCSPSTGTVCTKIAPAPNQTGSATVTTTYSYDNLDRPIGQTYSDGTTLSASFGYDGAALAGCSTAPPTLADTYPKGNRTAMCDGSGATSWAHDQMGRVLTESRTIVGTSPWTKSAGYTYNLDGSAKTISNPGVGRVMTYTTNAAGRPSSVVNTGGSLNFVTGATYTPAGALASYTNGTIISNTNAYNSRMQPLTLTAATTGTGAHTILSLSYDFHSSTHADNGNVYQIVNGRDGNRTQNFIYDSLNRIQQAYTNGNSPLTTSWGETFGPTATAPGIPPSSPGIDAWGNLTNRSGVTGKTNYEGLSAAPATAKNQLNGYCHDAAGNLGLNAPCPVPYNPTYTYDAENRLKTTAGWTYVYDGDGRRVKKVNGSAGTLYWPSLSGDTLNESSLGATNLREYVYFGGKRVARIDVPAPLSVKYYFSDHLGSASVITDSLGTMPALEESDYYPYGGEIVISNGDSNNYKFTGKERDTESGLDDFGARFNASSVGRFLTPDWTETPDPIPYADLKNPQSLNLYSFGLNNPLRAADPDGHYPVTTCAPDIWDEGTNTLIAGKCITMDNGGMSPGMLGPGDLILFSGVKTPAYVTEFFGKLFGSIFGDLSSDGIKITEEGMEHVLERHTADGAKSAGKSLFKGSEREIKSLIKKAGSTAPSKQGNGNLARVVDAGRTIGVDRATGASTSTYTVISKPSGDLVTAFPGKP